MKKLSELLSLGLTILFCFGASGATITLIDNDTLAYYNESIGTNLKGTSDAFPVFIDPDLDFTKAPDLSPALQALGGWLGTPPSLPPQLWTSIPVQVPRQWPLGTESAIVYQIDVPANGYRNVVMKFGVDNGIFVWLDGKYLGGFLRPGGACLGEHQFIVSNISGGTHYLQVLREDHGVADDYLVEVTAETDSPATATAGEVSN